jgi:hypothetical protein
MFAGISDTTRVKPETDAQVAPTDCLVCGSVMLVLNDEWLCLERCLSCNHSRLLGWFANDPLLLLGAMPAPHGKFWSAESIKGGLQ